MKKIAVLIVLFMGASAFAQTIPSYQEAGAMALGNSVGNASIETAKEKIKVFPAGFYFDVTEDGLSLQTEENKALFDAILTAYTDGVNEHNPVAVFNYANALLQYREEDENAAAVKQNRAYVLKVLDNALSLYPQDADLSDLKYKLLEEISEPAEETIENAATPAPKNLQQDRLRVLERKIASGGPNVTARDYHEAGRISESLGRHAAAETYYDMERNAGCEEMD